MTWFLLIYFLMDVFDKTLGFCLLCICAWLIFKLWPQLSISPESHMSTQLSMISRMKSSVFKHLPFSCTACELQGFIWVKYWVPEDVTLSRCLP